MGKEVVVLLKQLRGCEDVARSTATVSTSQMKAAAHGGLYNRAATKP
jgi:hypothetical protein